jgi:hypothetical protein
MCSSVAAVAEAARALGSDRAAPVAGYLLLALLRVPARLIALAFRRGETAGEPATHAPA